MDAPWENMKASDFASIIFGVVGLVLSLIAFFRAHRAEKRIIENERRTREIEFAREKQKVLNQLAEGETELRRANSRLLAIADSLNEIDPTGALAKVIKLKSSMDENEDSLSRLRGLSRNFEEEKTTGVSHEQLLNMIEGYSVSVKKLCDPNRINYVAQLLEKEAEHSIRDITIKREIANKLKQ